MPPVFTFFGQYRLSL